MIILAPPVCPNLTPNNVYYGVCNSALSDWYASWNAPWWITGAELGGMFAVLALVLAVMVVWNRHHPSASAGG